MTNCCGQLLHIGQQYEVIKTAHALQQFIIESCAFSGQDCLPFPNKRAKPELNPGLTRVKRCGIGTGLKVGLLAYRASF